MTSEFILSVTLGNDAMQDGSDVAALLRKVADEIDYCDFVSGGAPRTLLDVNGNAVGSYTVEGLRHERPGAGVL